MGQRRSWAQRGENGGRLAPVDAQGTETTHLPNLGALEAKGGLFTAYAVLRSVRKAQTRAGKPFVEVKLVDREGSAAGKIWSDSSRAMQAIDSLEVGDHVKALFEVDTYKGAVQLNVRRIRKAEDGDPGYSADSLMEEGYDLVSDILCKTLVFDIETAPAVDIRKEPSTIAQSVAKVAERKDWDQSKVMSLSPYFGKVISLAVGDGEQDPRTMEVTVFVVLPEGVEVDVGALPAWIRPVSEKDLLRAFWVLAGHAEVVVTYNGRGFDVPFLQGRSLIHDIDARVDLLSNRFSLRPHLDLYYALGQNAGPSSLDVVCWALGLTSPKEDMDGSMVASTYEKGDIASIALYNAGDVRATSGVYQRVRDKVLRFRDDW